MTPERIQAFLAKHQIKEAELARLLGVPHQTVNRWKRGTRTPRPASFVDARIEQLDRQLMAKVKHRAARPTPGEGER